MCPGGESPSGTGIFLWLCHSQSACILKKQFNRSTWFIFPCLIRHFLARHFLAKCSFHSSVHSLRSFQRGRLMKMGPAATSRKIQELVQQTFRKDRGTNIHVLSNLHSGVHHNRVMCAGLNSLCSWWHV